MKRLIAPRRLQKKCIHCQCSFTKGDIYYKTRNVFEEDGQICGSEYLECARCVYVQTERRERFNAFVEACKHPERFREMIWTYIPGEAVKEPDHAECRLCSKWV